MQCYDSVRSKDEQLERAMDPLLHDLDDPTKTCVLLPKKPAASGNVAQGIGISPSKVARQTEDYTARLRCYDVAWKTCISRFQTIVTELRSPVVSAVKKRINDAYSRDVIPGMPYVELPFIAVASPAGGRSVISDIVTILEEGVEAQQLQHGMPKGTRKIGKERAADDYDGSADMCIPSLVTHIHPTMCTSVALTMKSIITGFIEKVNEDENEEGLVQLPLPVKRKPTASLANHDISLLCAWYRALSEINDVLPHLVVVLHDLEQFDPSVMQDVFYICSKSIPQLPLIFLADSSAPSTMAYLHAAYSRASISLLRVHVHTVRSDIEFVNAVIEKIFFDPDFEPLLSLGPGTLDFLADFSSRITSLPDAILTILQIAYMKHFEQPLTAFCDTQQGAKILESEISRPVVEALLFRLWCEISPQARQMPEQELPDYLDGFDCATATADEILAVVEQARQDNRHDAMRMRLGYRVLKCVRKFMQTQGHKTTASATGQEDLDLIIMSRFVRGRASRDVKNLAFMLKKLSNESLRELVSELYSLFYTLQSSELRRQEANAREFLVRTKNSIPIEEGAETKKASAISATVSEWFSSFMQEHNVRPDRKPLWELWHTGATPFPSELINPAPRQTIINALLHPYEVVKGHRELFGPYTNAADEPNTPEERALWELPDTSILFRRYMEAGRMINVYDLFESFASVLDVQKEKTAKADQVPRTPQRAKGKGKQKAVASPETDEEESFDGDDAAWQRQVHARFIRALHELDYMGFVKHTNRKADHIMRTVYDIVD